MPNYEIIGKGKETGRRRRRTYYALNESEARQLAEADGKLVEEITEIPPEPATERQLDYARDLGISIPTDATKDDLSDLISLKLDRDKPATERHKTFGKLYRIKFSDYIGKKALFGRIQSALLAPGREKELLSWFTFRVYRTLAGGADNAPIAGPDDPIIEKIAEELVADEKVIKSVRRYEGSDLIWFGEWTAPNGQVYSGGSNRTTSYKQVASLLKQRARFPSKRQRKESHSVSKRGQRHKDTTEPKSCFSVVVLVLVILIGFSLLVAWIRGIFD